MKKMKYIILCLCAALGLTFTSCDSFLDITPEGQVNRDQQLGTTDGIEDALYGAYSQLRSTSLYGQELSFSSLEIMSQTLWCYGNMSTAMTINALGNYEYTYSGVENIFEAVWISMYENIRNVNSIINSPLVENATEYPYTIYRGEALALRAFMHFDLVRLYAEQYTVNPAADGIPYATEFSLNTPDFESLAKNYEHILADLHEAELLLENEDKYEGTSNFMLDRQIHLNKYAVKALLARVYLTMGNKEKALEYAVEVIDSRKYILKEKTEVVNDLAGVLSRKETLWGVYFADFFTQVNAKLQQTTSYYSLDLRNDFMELYEKDASGIDFRVSAYFSTVDQGGTPKYRLCKFTDVYEQSNNTGQRPSDLILGINMIRIPEMYYIAAECLLDVDYDRALNYYNEVRTHRGLDPLGITIDNGEESEEEGGEGVEPADTNLTIERINEERYKEYIGEGQTFFNMKRQNLSILSHDGETVHTASKKMYVVPIPDIEKENRN
ncbi:MAG: RagB/SusD family nutrient uptake outer membrane protein [Bacteroidaceae bacterium]|nr:RagB/SusD family nutrient uptake outer membrane protein [Bacteroidaceae bacterium]